MHSLMYALSYMRCIIYDSQSIMSVCQMIGIQCLAYYNIFASAMHYICTDNPEEQKQLELEFSTKNNLYLIPHKQTYCITQLLASISFEFFQNHIPLLADKIKQIIVSSFSNTYNLNTYREILAIIQKQSEEMKLFKDYLIEMNTAFAESRNDIDLENDPDDELADDSIFLETLKGESHVLQNLQLCQLPIFSQLRGKCDSQQTTTQKTMQSDLCFTKMKEITQFSLNLNSSSTLKNFFQQTYSRDDWKTDRKKEELEVKESSSEMSSFNKRGSTILDCNKDLSQLLIKEQEYDISRQMNLAQDCQQRHIEIEKHRYQQKIKSTLVNYKLRMRRSN